MLNCRNYFNTSAAESNSNEQFVMETETPPFQPVMSGDKQTPETRAFLKRWILEDRYNAFCIDCQRKRSTHANVYFGTFLCLDCAEVHI